MKAKWKELADKMEKSSGLKMPVLKSRAGFVSFFKENKISPSDVAKKGKLDPTCPHVMHDRMCE